MSKIENIAYYFIILWTNMTTIMEQPLNRIKEVIEEQGIKQKWLAAQLGKSFCIVNSYVCNRRQPSIEILFEIAKILKVNPKDLLKTPEFEKNSEVV